MSSCRSALVLLFILGGVGRAADNFAGTWETEFGQLILTQQGNEVKGSYQLQGKTCTLQGKVEKSKLTFTYREPTAAGEGWFVLAPDGKSFEGKWREVGAKDWEAWAGKRTTTTTRKGFAGLWQTNFGKMRLVQEGDQVTGTYAYAAGSSVTGKALEKKLIFEYHEPNVAGEGEFELSPDDNGFAGKWREKGQTQWQQWNGKRIGPQIGKVWLIIVEARWEHDLNEKEYAFGEMLRAFFARTPHVEVRHRFYTDEPSLRKYLAEVAYIPEPVVLVLATHACAKGITVGDKVIGATPIAESLRYAGNLRLLHFSACEALKERLAADIHEQLDKHARFPISGYTREVDWAASAILEFTYLDLVLARNLSPEAAAKQLPKLLRFAGEEKEPDSVYPPTGFRLVMPPQNKE